jgi:hypothetical protein
MLNTNIGLSGAKSPWIPPLSGRFLLIPVIALFCARQQQPNNNKIHTTTEDGATRYPQQDAKHHDDTTNRPIICAAVTLADASSVVLAGI